MHTKETYSSSRLKLSVVYWVHYEHHINPYTEGYIGITTNIEKRLNDHLRYNRHVGNRIKNGAKTTILHTTQSLYEAAEIEKSYRKTENIGWNITAGGDIPPDRSGKSSGAVLLSGEARTEKQKLASIKHADKMQGNVPWNKGLTGVQVPWNKGITNENLKIISTTEHCCPYCNLVGKGSSMKRWHFENCRHKNEKK